MITKLTASWVDIELTTGVDLRLDYVGIQVDIADLQIRRCQACAVQIVLFCLCLCDIALDQLYKSTMYW